MVFNLIDALVATWVLTMIESRRRSTEVESDVSAIVAACLAGAVVTMLPAGAVVNLVTGTLTASNVANWVIGHALGSLTFGPFMFLCMRGQMQSWLSSLLRGHEVHALVRVLLLIGCCVVAFTSPHLPLLFMPVLALTALTYRAGLPGAAFGSVLLALIGGGLTLAGQGGMVFGAPALTFQFFQFFLGVTTVTMLPVSAVISARREMTARLQHSEAGYRLLADNIEDIVVQLDLKGRLTYVSPSIRNFAGQRPSQVLGNSAIHLVDPRCRPGVRTSYLKLLAARGEPISFEFVGTTKNEQKRWFEMQGRCVLGANGEPESVVGTVRDTTDRKMLESALKSAAETDALTGLLNRRAFFDAAQTTASASSTCYLAIFDIDHLDAMNAAFGNQTGDLALQTFARVARSVVRGRDLLGRLVGDTFGLILPNASYQRAEAICRRVLVILASERLDHDGRVVSLAVSAGLAPLREDFGAAMRAARSALALAKEGGRASLRLAA
jgi:diguanylate cyclase (GGDEF)-like protein/PAS domain S-box-containing protein